MPSCHTDCVAIHLPTNYHIFKFGWSQHLNLASLSLTTEHKMTIFGVDFFLFLSPLSVYPCNCLSGRFISQSLFFTLLKFKNHFAHTWVQLILKLSQMLHEKVSKNARSSKYWCQKPVSMLIDQINRINQYI